MTATRKNQVLKDKKDVVHQNKFKEGLTVKCVCPKCGNNHRVKMIWTGRGKPKKFCPPCKIFVSSVEPIDFCAVPADMHAGID